MPPILKFDGPPTEPRLAGYPLFKCVFFANIFIILKHCCRFCYHLIKSNKNEKIRVVFFPLLYSNAMLQWMGQISKPYGPLQSSTCT